MAKTDVLAASNLTESDDDTISLTSTQYASENSDQEYLVEDILAEDRDNQDGGQIYLVKWTGYPLEKCTWEPKENIDDDMLEHLWEAKRRKPDFRPFDFRILADAVNQKNERHFRRNRARQRRNLPLTEPTDPLEAWLGPPIPATDNESSPEAPPSDAAGRAASNDVDVEMADDGEGGMLKDGVHSAALFIADGEDTLNPSDDDVIVLGALSRRTQPKKKQKKKHKTKETETPNLASAVNAKKSTKAPKSLETSVGNDTRPTTEKNTTEVAKAVAMNKLATQRTNQPATANRLEAADSKKRTFSARKSGLAYGSQVKEVNVFTGGKKTTRTTKSQTAITKKRQDFYFPNLHVRHMAEVRARQKEDREIDPKQINKLFPIAGRGQPIIPVAGDTGRRASTTAPNQPEARPQGSPPSSTPPPPGVLVNTATSDQAVPKKAKKKSVRFSGADESDPSYRAATATSSVENALVLDGDVVYQEPEQFPTTTQSVTKTLALGEQGRPVEAKFSGVPLSEGSDRVLQAFLGEDLLLFGYMCLAATFLDQYGGFRQRVLFSGGVSVASAAESESAQAMLDTASERLKVTASCLVFARPSYLIVLYPVRADEWKDEPFGRPLQDDETESVLRYLTFSTKFDCTPFLQPFRETAPPWEQGLSSKIQDRARLMRAFFELDWGVYKALLPRNGRLMHAKRNFFLAFPPSAPFAIQQMAFWLRSVDPNCVLFLSVNPGAWMAFQEKVVAESEVGVVLVHEVATSSIRRFPGLTDLLLTDAKDCKFWSVSQSILTPPLFPSPRLLPDTVARFNDTVYRPGHFRLVQLFPRGLAVLLTPSFIVTEPQRTFALLEWFYNRRLSCGEGVTLVTAGNICEHLRDVADEKARQRNEILDNRNFRSPSDRDDAALKMGIDRASCDDHYKAWLLATEICASPQTSDWCVFQADDAIDNNDEQSLVNWFGWFCTVHMDRFRSFYVVGSKGAIKTTESGRGRCRIRMPRFSLGTVANPDGIRHASEANRDPQPLASTNIQFAPSRAYPGVFTTEFSSYLRRHSRADQFWKIYGYPVLWKDNNEAYRHGCVDSAYTTIPKWFSYTWPFQRHHRGFIGLFYPIDEDVQSALRWDRRPRHPWLVIYRPVKPHLWPFTETELVFWDPRAESRFAGRPVVRQTDLTKAQQAVIEFVAANGTKKNKDMPLTTLYIGGNCSGATDPFDEFDMTMQQLRDLAQDYKNVLPPRITERGYRRVLMADQLPETDERSPDERTTGDRNGNKTSIGIGDSGVGDSRSTSTEVDTGAPTKIVFHPPRGDAGVVPETQAPQAGEKTRSRCSNDLFECAQRVLAEKPDATTFMYEFRPTMDWYGEQVEEGRDFGHIHVNSWEAFFNAFRIEAGEDEADPAEDEADSAVSADDSD